MENNHTRRGSTQEVVHKNGHCKFNLESHHVLLSKERSRIKYGMTALFNNGNNECVEDPRLQPSGMTPLYTPLIRALPTSPLMGKGSSPVGEGTVPEGCCPGMAAAPAPQVVMRGQVRGHSRGFTLIELLVVVLIIGILAAVALPQYQKVIIKTRLLEYENTFKLIAQAHQICHLRNDRVCTLDELDIEIPSCNPLPGFFSSCTYQIYSYPTNEIRIMLTSEGKQAFGYFPQETTLQHRKNEILYRETLQGIYCNSGDNVMDDTKCNKLGFSEFIIYGYFKRPN